MKKQAPVVLEIVRGEDWTTDIIWSDQYDTGMPIAHPCRMDIKSPEGSTLVSLITDPDIPDGDIPTIALSPNIGLMQLHLDSSVTGDFNPGNYVFDLFATYDDGNDYIGPQYKHLVSGQVLVLKNITTLGG